MSKLHSRTAGDSWPAQPDDLSILDGDDDRRRAGLIAERLTPWKSYAHA